MVFEPYRKSSINVRFKSFDFLIFFHLNIRMGLRGRELLSSLGKVMIQGGGTFGTFMAIGTAIRC